MRSAIQDLIRKCKPAVAQFSVTDSGRVVGTGSGFLVNGKLITNAHVLPTGTYEKVRVGFGGGGTALELEESEVATFTVVRSEPNEYDYVVIALPEESNIPAASLEFEACDQLGEGEQVVFFGFPFGTRNLTAHVGYISSVFTLKQVHRFQIDGSINPGNSGGPLVRVSSGKCIGVVTQTQTGLEQDFDDLIKVLGQNLVELSKPRGGRVLMGGFDPIEGARATMAALEIVAKNVKRSANVGIGYAFCAEHLTDNHTFE